MTLSRELAQASRRFADKQSDRLADLPGLRGTFLTISSVTGGVFVSWRGGDYQVAKVLPSYTPGVGDRVLVLIIDDQLVVVG